MIAALYVAKGGCYFGLPNVDPWDESRDARLYVGPWPVVAHPPCARWCRLAGFVEHRFGYKRGEDGGCFESALASVRKYGGVIEHPAYSDAWTKFGLPLPSRHGWWQRGMCGGWSCHVEQGRYGHAAKKATWLYAFGCASLPSLLWGSELDTESERGVSWCGNRTKKKYALVGRAHLNKPGRKDNGGGRRRLRERETAATPPAFRNLLISIAESCHG